VIRMGFHLPRREETALYAWINVNAVSDNVGACDTMQGKERHANQGFAQTHENKVGT
jgi:hypothetical protein